MLTVLFSLRDCFRARAALQAEILALAHLSEVDDRSDKGWILALDGAMWIPTKLDLNVGIYGTSLAIGPTKPGMSGSPILNDRGPVVGVVAVGSGSVGRDGECCSSRQTTNANAVRLWQSCGFQVVGRLPDAFLHPRLGYVNALVMYRAQKEAA